MARQIEVSEIIKRPVEEVFAFLADFGNASKYRKTVVDYRQTSPGPMRVGTTGREIVRMMGRRTEFGIEVLEYVPNSRLVFRTTSGPMPLKGTQLFEPVEGEPGSHSLARGT